MQSIVWRPSCPEMGPLESKAHHICEPWGLPAMFLVMSIPFNFIYPCDGKWVKARAICTSWISALNQ